MYTRRYVYNSICTIYIAGVRWVSVAEVIIGDTVVIAFTAKL